MQSKEKLVNDIIVYQDDELYTFTSDSILLSLFAKAKKGDIVADFCAGSGVVGLNFYALNSNLINSVTFFEVQNSLFELCKKSIEEMGGELSLSRSTEDYTEFTIQLGGEE